MKQTPLILAVLVIIVVALGVAYKMGKLPYFKPAATDATATTTAAATKSTFAGRLFGPGSCAGQDENGASFDRCLHV